jgi:hypothetical protein
MKKKLKDNDKLGGSSLSFDLLLQYLKPNQKTDD